MGVTMVYQDNVENVPVTMGVTMTQRSIHAELSSHCTSSLKPLQPGQTLGTGRNVALPSPCDIVSNLHLTFDRALLIPSPLPITESVHGYSWNTSRGFLESSLCLRNSLILEMKGFKRHKSACWFLVLRAKVLGVFMSPQIPTKCQTTSSQREASF